MTKNTTVPDSTLLWDSPDVEPLSGVFTLSKICEKRQQRHQGVKRSDMDDESTMNAAETLETMTIHLLSGNQGLPWCRFADNARHRCCNSRLVLTRMDVVTRRSEP